MPTSSAQAPGRAPREAGAADAPALSLERALLLGHRPAGFAPGAPGAPPAALPGLEGKPLLQPKGMPISGDLTGLGPDFPRQNPAWIGRAVSPSPLGVIARAAMDKILAAQGEREGALKAGTDKAGRGPGTFTTVGFEWDVAHLAEHSEKSPNYLQGLSHLELAESELRQHALAYLLETDADNTLELVTPPFLVRTRAAGDAMPVKADLQAIVNAMFADLGTLVATAKNVGQLIDADWSPFGIGRWIPREVVASLDWRNWSHRSGAGVRGNLEKYGYRGVAIDKVFPHGDFPQINIAGTAKMFEAIEDKKGSRVESNATAEIEEKLHKFIISKAVEAETPEEVKLRLELFLRHLTRVMAQQSAVPSILELAKLQKTGFAEKEEVTVDQLKGPANRASYIKDATNVWLKADLVTYGLSFLEPVDWAALGPILTQISKELRAQKGQFLSESDRAAGVPDLMQGVVENLRERTAQLAKVYGPAKGEAEEKRSERIDGQVTEILREIQGWRPKLNQHDVRLLGVRQDTFIPPLVLQALAKELGLGRILHVMEVRKASSLIDSPAAKAEKKGGAAAKGGADQGPAAKKDEKGGGSKKDEKGVAELLEIAEAAYDSVIALARRQGGAIKELPDKRGRFREGNPLTKQQLDDLAENKSRLVPTSQDGDCSINAVFDSRGTITSARTSRFKIAKRGLAEGMITRQQAETILQPGDWSLSHIMLPILAGLLEIRIVIVGGDGTLTSVGQPTKGFVRIFHVDGPKPHYYGSRT